MADLFMKALQSVRGAVMDAAHPDIHQRDNSWHAFETAQVALAAFPNRKASVAYVLGINAGLGLANSDQIPGNPFRATTSEANDYATGIKDALAVELLATRYHAAAFGGAQ